MRHRLTVVTSLVTALAASSIGCSGASSDSSSEASDTAGLSRGAATSTAGASSVTAAGSATATATTTTTKTNLQANNTSASNLFRDLYTPDASFFGEHIGVVTNGDNPVPSVSAPSLSDGAISKISLHTLLPANAATKIFFENQAWFCTNGEASISSALGKDLCGSHIDIGYSVNTTAQVTKQVADMMSRGADGTIVDWSGTSQGDGVLDGKSTSATAINMGALFAFKTAAEATKGAFQFSVSEDEAAKTSSAAHGGDWTQGVLADITFLASHFFASPAYYRSEGRPVLFVFGVDDYASKAGKSVDWAYLSAHAPGNPLFVFENVGHTEAAGGYSWPKPTPIASYPGSDPFDVAGYLPDFYAKAKSDKEPLNFGLGYKGFDDHAVNGWVRDPSPSNPNETFVNGERYSGQQCGKTWLDSFKMANANVGSIAGVQLATWDDYEEATELETGIDNHLAITPAVTGSTLSWTLGLASGSPEDCIKAVSDGFDISETVHHFAVYASPAGDGENLTLLQDDIAPTTRSLDLTGKLAQGSWLLSVRAVGQPSITNKLSASVAASGSSSGGGDGGAGSTCSGVPTILEPTRGEDVGPSIHLRVSAPSCMETMIAYIDGKPVAQVKGDAIDQWVSVSLGAHALNVNGWAGTNDAHVSTTTGFTRTY